MFASLGIIGLLAATPWTFPSESLPDGVVTKSSLKEHVPGFWWEKTRGRMRIVTAGAEAPFPRVAIVHYPRGQWGTTNSGAQWMVRIPPAEQTSCQYSLRFDPRFDFVKGGKLPGLAGGQATTGNDRPTGDGWSARYMWRRDGAAVVYLYHLDQPKRHGEDLPLEVQFRPGVWHQLKQTVRVNDPGQSNGRIRVWFDERLVLDRKNIRQRTGQQAPVDRFYFSTFFGGKGKDWAPRQDQHIEFADIKVWSVTKPSERAN